MELKELYQEIILDRQNPRNKGKCEGYNHDAKAHNPSVEIKYTYILSWIMTKIFWD